MEHQKNLNSLNELNNSKFLTRKWNIVNDQMQIMMRERKLPTIQKC